jgi:hypothetical protein
MGKVSIGLRGWRFEESNVFTGDGEFRPLEEMPSEDRKRIIRLPVLMERPCDACYQIYGEKEKRRCGVAAVVYGEPFEEVVLCEDHEPDFAYWYREAGGAELRGTEAFKDAFQDWFADGGRAPEGYGGFEHVDTDPENLPEPPDSEEIQERLESGVETDRLDLRALSGAVDHVFGVSGVDGDEGETRDASEDREPGEDDAATGDDERPS